MYYILFSKFIKTEICFLYTIEMIYHGLTDTSYFFNHFDCLDIFIFDFLKYNLISTRDMQEY